MAIELRLEKTDGEPWGFRLTGGSDFEAPLTVVKITDGSAAYKNGLQIGDVLLKINNVDLREMSHSEAQEIITRSGPSFIIGIFRGELSEIQCSLIAEEQSNEEVFNIMEGSIPIDYPERPYYEESIQQKQESTASTFMQHDLNLTDEEIHSIINPEKLETKPITRNEQETSETTRNNKNSMNNEQTLYNSEQNREKNVEESDSIERRIKQEEIHKMEEIMKEEQQLLQEQQSEEAQRQNGPVIWGSQVKVQQSEVLKAVHDYLSEMEVESRKWSTFMQKPNNPKPKGRVQETEKVKNQYRVVIRTKKDLEAEIAAKKAAEEAALAAELAAIQAAEEAAKAAEEEARLAEEAAKIAEEQAELLLEETLAAAERAAENAAEMDETKDEDEDESKSEATSKHLSGKEAVLTVEQQLAQVKEQLLALSELPATIQMTLGIITEQLQKLAREAQPEGLNDDRDEELSNADNTETEDEVTELLALESQEGLSVIEENESDHGRVESGLEEFVMEESRLAAEEIARQEQLDEEVEAKRLEEERTAKKEKVGHWNQIWPWTKVTQPIYRINFLKYQPPPKNLDHLHRSEVYKMVHDLDAPPRGIIARPEKVPAVQDYLVKTNGDEEKQLPPQMER